MKLMTKEIESKLPALYANEDKEPEDINVVVKFFHPFSHWTWFATEGSKQEDGDWLFFGWVEGDFPELGYFSLRELESINIMGLPMERDRHYGYDHTLAEVMERSRA